MNVIYQIMLKLNALMGIRKFRLACYFFALMSLFYSCYNMAYNTQDVSDAHYFKNLMGKSYRLKTDVPLYEEWGLINIGEFGYPGMPLSSEEYINHPTDWWTTEKYKIRHPQLKNFKFEIRGMLPAGTVFKVYKVEREVYLGNVGFQIIAEVNEEKFKFEKLGVDFIFKIADGEDTILVPDLNILEEVTI